MFYYPLLRVIPSLLSRCRWCRSKPLPWRDQSAAIVSGRGQATASLHRSQVGGPLNQRRRHRRELLHNCIYVRTYEKGPRPGCGIRSRREVSFGHCLLAFLLLSWSPVVVVCLAYYLGTVLCPLPLPTADGTRAATNDGQRAVQLLTRR